MDMANAVGFWDKGPEAIGEDAHMFFKCFYKTRGIARTETIWYPVVCYNITGDSYVDSLNARLKQLIRHLWGTLDLGYILQNNIFRSMNPFSKLVAVWELMKIRTLPPTYFILLFLIPKLLPYIQPLYNEEPYYWVFASIKVFQLFVVIPYIITAVEYEKFHEDLIRQEISRGSKFAKYNTRTRMNMLEWVVGPAIGMIYLTIASLYVHFLQMFTDKLEYKVASKPGSSSPPSSPATKSLHLVQTAEREGKHIEDLREILSNTF